MQLKFPTESDLFCRRGAEGLTAPRPYAILKAENAGGAVWIICSGDFFWFFSTVNIHFGVSTVDFLPSWLGYLLMIKGLDTLAEESERFAAARPWCVGMAVYTGVLWIADLFALGAELTFFTWLLGLAGTCVSFYITSIILDGIDRMQLRHGEIGAAGLRKAWQVAAIATIGAYLLSIVQVIMVICLLISAVANIVFLVRMHATRRAWNELRTGGAI